MGEQITALKQQRSQLRKYIPRIRHTVSKRQAIKKEKQINYMIGRMVFFDEDIKTAAAITKQQLKTGGFML